MGRVSKELREKLLRMHKLACEMSELESEVGNELGKIIEKANPEYSLENLMAMQSHGQRGTEAYSELLYGGGDAEFLVTEIVTFIDNL